MRSRGRSSTSIGGMVVMSVTGKLSGQAGPVGVGEVDGGLLSPAHCGGENPPSTTGIGSLREVIDDSVLDLLLERSKDGAGGLRLTGEGSMLGELVKAVLERALEAELSAHLGYDKHDPVGNNSGNS